MGLESILFDLYSVKIFVTTA